VDNHARVRLCHFEHTCGLGRIAKLCGLSACLLRGVRVIDVFAKCPLKFHEAKLFYVAHDSAVPVPSPAVGRVDELHKQLDALLSRYEKDKKIQDAYFAKLDKTPLGVAVLGSTLGAESATGDQEKIEDSNRKLKKQLCNPTFARSYFAAQRLTRNAVLRSRAI
jgi:hypothetical protein